jgi:uncharacterized protein YrrD
MLRKANDVEGYALHAQDGIIGKAVDFYFEEGAWTIRYLVVGTGAWLSERSVLISPIAVKMIDAARKTISVELTKEQIRNSPAADVCKLITREYEERYFSYYRWAPYWGGPRRWGYWPAPTILAASGEPRVETLLKENVSGRPNMRDMNEIEGYSIKARDGAIGDISDFIFDDETWAVRYVEVDTRKWLPSKHVLLPPQLIGTIREDMDEVAVTAARSAIQDAPPYDPSVPITRTYEETLLAHYRLKQ